MVAIYFECLMASEVRTGVNEAVMIHPARVHPALEICIRETSQLEVKMQSGITDGLLK